MRLITITILLLLCVGQAGAVIDPDPNKIGIYFDLNADQACYDALANTPFQMHIMLTNSTYDEISGFECTYTLTTPTGYEHLVFNLGMNFYGGLNIGSAGALYGNLVVGYPSPRQATPAFPLATATMMLLGDFRVEGYMGPAEIPSLDGDVAVIEIGGALAPVSFSSGSSDQPLCVINPSVEDDPCPPYYPPVDPLTPFEVDINASINGYSDIGNLAGSSVYATDAYDVDIDIPQPGPPPSDYVLASFYHPEWALGPRFATDLRSLYNPDAVGKIWTFRVETDQVGTVALDFLPNFTEADGVRLYLKDVSTGQFFNLYPNLTFTYASDGAGPREFELRIGGMAPPELDPTARPMAAGWSLVGMPLIPAAGADTWNDVILDAAPGAAFLYDYAGASGYAMVDGATTAALGSGFWFGTDTAFDWTMAGDPERSGVSVPMDTGWNILGFPMWFAGPKEGIQVEFEGTQYPWLTAADMGLVAASVMDYDSVTDRYASVNTLEPWHGYWVSILTEGVSLWFDYPNFQTMPKRIYAPEKAFWPAEEAWRLELSLGQQKATAKEITLGVRPTATAGFDPLLDEPCPPPSPTAAERLSVRRSEWDLACGDDFLTDLVAPGADVFSWTVRVTLPEPGEFTLNWERINWPKTHDLQLYLPADNRVVSMSMLKSSSVTLTSTTRVVDLVIRTPDMASGVEDTPVRRYAIGVHPNPFNPMTKIAFEMPSAGRAEVRIYSVRGELVATVGADAYQAGRHEVMWRGQDDGGRDVPSGSYFAKLYADGKGVGTVTKMSLVR